MTAGSSHVDNAQRSSGVPVIDDQLVRQRFLDHPDSQRSAREVLQLIVSELYPLLDEGSTGAVADRLAAELLGLGPLDHLLGDDDVSDILVNGPGFAWVERAGVLSRSDVKVSAADLDAVVERVFAERGLSIDRSHPIGDTRLADGSRVSVVIEPLVVGGTHLAVRRFSNHLPDLDAFGPPHVVAVLRQLVDARANMVVFGPTGAGKTSLVNALCARVAESERIITIEDAAELRIGLPHVVTMECRPANSEGAGGVTLRELVRAALRLRPDRIVVGEVRGAEALDMVWAMATGHDGSLSTCHAKSPSDALMRLETFVMLADAALPLVAVRAQVRSAVDVVIGVRRSAAGRQVSSIHRVVDDPTHPTGVVALTAADFATLW